MNNKQELNQIPLLPSGPQPEAKNGESKQNPIIPIITEVLPQGEGDEGDEGLDHKATNQEGVTEFSETFSDKLNSCDLPQLLQDIEASQADAEDKDTMILGALNTFSGAMPNCFGVYDQRKVYPPFYLIIYAPPSSDKGALKACRQLVTPIEMEIEASNQKEPLTFIVCP